MYFLIFFVSLNNLSLNLFILVLIAEPLMSGKYLLNERSEMVISSLISDSDFLINQ